MGVPASEVPSWPRPHVSADPHPSLPPAAFSSPAAEGGGGQRVRAALDPIGLGRCTAQKPPAASGCCHGDQGATAAARMQNFSRSSCSSLLPLPVSSRGPPGFPRFLNRTNFRHFPQPGRDPQQTLDPKVLHNCCCLCLEHPSSFSEVLPSSLCERASVAISIVFSTHI